MSLRRLLFQSLLFHWRGNLAVLLGVAVGTAVLAGALIIGDSLRGSLRERALDQLGWVDQALVAGRFFRADLATDQPSDHTAPAIMLRGIVLSEKSRAGQVMIMGEDDRFWGESPPTQKDLW